MAELLTDLREPIRRWPDAADVDALSQRLGEDAVLRALRRDALERFATGPAPSRTEHRWRYADVRDYLPEDLAASSVPTAVATLPDRPAGGAAILCQAEAAVAWQISSAARRAGLTIQALAETSATSDLLGHVIGAELGLLEAFNLASWSAGVLITVPKNRRVEGPVWLRLHAAQPTSVTRVVVVVEHGASLHLVEEHVGDGELVSAATEIIVRPGAELRHTLLQDWGSRSKAHLQSRARVERDARYKAILATTGGRRVKVDVGAELSGSGAQSEIFGLALGGGSRRLDHHTEQQHLAEHTRSRLDFRTAMWGRARSAYTGTIHIAKSAPFSEAYQENRNLLLSARARAHSIPELEIETDEVSCSHGATIAPLDPQQLLYLQSRGLPPQRAEQLAVEAFFAPSLERFDTDVRERLRAVLRSRLGHDEVR